MLMTKTDQKKKTGAVMTPCVLLVRKACKKSLVHKRKQVGVRITDFVNLIVVTSSRCIGYRIHATSLGGNRKRR